MILIALLIIYVIYIVLTRKIRINRVEKMRRNHASFDDKFGKVGATDTLSWGELKRIARVSESEMWESDKVFEKKEQKRKYEEAGTALYERIKQKYPVGVSMYEKRNPDVKYINYYLYESEIKRLDAIGREYEAFNDWLNRQNSYASKSRDLSPDAWGCYPYNIGITGVDEQGEDKKYEFKIWQHFVESYCSDVNLDYAYFQRTKQNFENLEKFRNQKRFFKTFVYDKVLEIIKGLSDNVIVLFLDSEESSDTIPYSCSLYEYHFGYLRDQLDNNGIRNWDTAYESFIIENNQDIVIVELITSNAHLKKVCKELFEKYRGCHPCITYISMLKEHTSKEMSALILQQEKRIKEQEEQKQKEQAEKRQLEAEKKRIELERKRQAELKEKERTDTTNALYSAVSSWGTVPSSDLHHEFLIRYYPTTCDFEATEEEWTDRQLIWSFKNDPDKNPRIPYRVALDELVPRIEGKLKSTFGSLISNLTLVCIPASTPEKNKARYEYFSDLICRRTGMINAYSHISVNVARLARHVGGAAGDLDTITFDDDFFKGKNVLLFDDVMTRGDSMRKYRLKMKSLGASVIAGFTIGKTCHTREMKHVKVFNFA